MSERARHVRTSSSPAGLSADSYTAKRLHHASPQHIHATSRRCFIGPIPEAWLSRHRKSWYRYRPHLSTYSSKAATFDATANVSFTRQLSGLDSEAPASPRYAGPSFPQPDDVFADDPMVMVEPTSPDVPQYMSTGRLLVSSKKSLPKNVSFFDGKVQGTNNPSNPIDTLQLSRPPLVPRFDSGLSDGPGSFVTAAESSSEQPRSPQDRKPLETVESKDGHPESDLGPRPRQSIGSSVDAPPIAATGKSTATANSTSSLLRQESTKDSSKTSPTRDEVANAADTANNSPDEALEESIYEIPHMSTGLVHFDLSNRREHTHSLQAARPKPTAFASLFQSHTQPGELIKAERMLVRVDRTKADLPPTFNENEALRIETTPIEKWREYMVVCRRPGEQSSEPSGGEDESDESFILQMSRSRIIPMVDFRRTSKRCAHEVVLRRSSTRVNLYSSLDKTIVLWTKAKKGTTIFILRPRSALDAVEWFTFFNSLLGWRRPQVLPIHVPDLNVTLNIDKPFHSLQPPLEELADNQNEEESVLEDLDKGTIAYDLVERSMKLLNNSPVSGNLSAWLQKEDRIGLAWKHYDRLEWVHGINEKKMYGSMAMQQSHDLELRLKQHYPTSVIAMGKAKKTAIEEPAPVEGFLIRLTSQKGRHTRFGKQFFKRLYFSTHNQFLCFSQPGKALPPKPPKMIQGTKSKNTPKTSELAGTIPLIYAVNPFPLHNGQIAWLREQSSSSKAKLDEVALDESERKIQTLLTMQGYIDLCKVQVVRKANETAPTTQSGDDEGDNTDWTDGESSLPEDARATSAKPEESIFEMVLQNGLTVRLQAYDKLACHEWIKRLRRLSAYWKHRTAADMRVYKSTRQQNLRALDINEEMESALGQFADKWEVSRAIASAELFNMCGISCCRSITMSGTLYYKPRYRSKFQRCTVILSNGKLLVFQDALRARSGKVVDHIHHERQHVLSLEDTYIYSGLITEGDLLYQNQTFDSNNPGHHALRRVYLEDQWTSSDEDTMTCFVIWYRKSKSLFRAPTEKDDGQMQHKLRYVSTLGRPGRSVVFKTRSRAERDHWVMSISLEIDRIAQTEDIRVIKNDTPVTRLTPM